MFEQERETFKLIRERLTIPSNKKNIEEFETSLKKLLYEYDTAKYENRFVVGGVVEILFCSLIRSLNIEAIWLNENRYDILINGARFSLKSNFTGNGDIRLINILGNEKVEWKESTLFIIGGLGICYLDPDLGVSTYKTNDATLIKIKDIAGFIRREHNWLIPIEIPIKNKQKRRSKTASLDVARNILENIDSKVLINHFPDFF